MGTAGQSDNPVNSKYIATAETLRRLQSAAAQAVQRGAVAEANALLRQALSLQPADANAWFALGAWLQQLGAIEESVTSYRQALLERPGFPEALNNQAAALRALRRPAEARACADHAIALRPAYPRALNNRGLIALDAGHGAVAVEDFRSALALEPGFAEARHNLATALMQLRRYGEAQEAFAALPPGFPHALGNALFAQLCDCNWRDYEKRSAAVAEAVREGLHAATPMTFLSMSGNPDLQLRCAALYAQAYFPGRATAQDAVARKPGRKLRIGYLSGDLGEHAVSYLLAGVLERHDPERFEVFAFSWGRKSDGEIRRRLERAVTRFIGIDELSDAGVVRLMRDSGIDIAVDLCGHTEGQRTGILAQRAAVLQVNFLGLPATMGAPYVDYLIADPFLVPASLEGHYAERIVRLSGGYQPSDDRRPAVPDSATRAALGLPEVALVLCCFNRSAKITPEIFAVWLRLLQSVPDAVLWLLATHPAVVDNLRREAIARGVAPERLIFADQCGYSEYLSRYRHADLFLDTAPFNGGATVGDALSMGVPVLTLSGEAFAGRMAGSCLTALGCPELVTDCVAAYEREALALALDRDHLRRLREQFRQSLTTHPYFDTQRYCLQLEAAYHEMAARTASGLPPASFTVGHP